MLTKVKGIILNTIPYGDNSAIIKCYTQTLGMQSYLVNSIHGKRAAVKPSMLLPLTLTEMEVNFMQGKNLQRIKEIKAQPPLFKVHSEMPRTAIAMFMAELLVKCLREENHPDENLFHFLSNTIQILDLQETSLANFPLVFLYKLSGFMGFNPKANYDSLHKDFSLMEGMFVADAPFGPDFIHYPLSHHFFELGRTGFDNMHLLDCNKQTRQALMDKLIRYFQLHILLFGELKSPGVLQEVFA